MKPILSIKVSYDGDLTDEEETQLFSELQSVALAAIRDVD
jgi:hypothetical protein